MIPANFCFTVSTTKYSVPSSGLGGDAIISGPIYDRGLIFSVLIPLKYDQRYLLRKSVGQATIGKNIKNN